MSRRSYRPNRGGGEAARALKRDGRKKNGSSGKGGDESEDEPPQWLANAPNALTGSRYVPSTLSSASGIYVNGVPPITQFAANSGSSGSSSGGVTFVPLNQPVTTSTSSTSTGQAPVIYRSSVHGIPQAVEVSDQQLLTLTKAITATRAHDFHVQSALLSGGSVGAGAGAGGSTLAGDQPLFASGDDLGTPLFSDDAAPSASPASVASESSSSTHPLHLASTLSPPGSLPWLRLQVGHALESLLFRRRLIKAAQQHVITAQSMSQGFATHRELMAQLQDFRTTRSNTAANEIDHVQLVQRATQAAIDWLLVHANESDLPKTFASHAQRLTVVDTTSDAAVTLDVTLHEKVAQIQELGLGFSRTDIIDAFHQVAGDYADLTSVAKTSSTRALDALDTNLVLWTLMDWFDLRQPPSQAAIERASQLELTDEDRVEVIENERIVMESMFPEVATNGRTPGALRIPVTVTDLPDGGFLEIAHPSGNLYPCEPPLLIFTHPSLSIEAKRAAIAALYHEAWELVGEPMAYTLHEWLQSNLVATLRPLFPDEMRSFTQAAIIAAKEKARLEKEQSADYKKKQAKLLAKAKEAERIEREEAARKKVDKEFAAKKAREEVEAAAVTSKRIGAAVGMFQKLRLEEETEEQRRQARIEQMKAILEAESSPQPSSSSTDPTVDSSLTAPIPLNDPSTLPLETNVANPFGADDQLIFNTSDDFATASFDSSSSTLFVPQPIDPRLSAQLKKDWERLKSGKKFQEILAKRQTLPAYQMKQQIVDMIEKNQVVVLSGSTGCGQ